MQRIVNYIMEFKRLGGKRMNFVKVLISHRKLLLETSRTDIKAKYSATFFGLVWTFLYPLLFLGMYAMVFTFIFQVRLEQFTTFDYVLLIFSGLIPFLGFSEALGTGVSSVVDNKSLIKNTLYPIELIPVKSVLTSSVTMLVGFLMLITILLVQGKVYWSQLLIPFVFLLQLLFTIGTIWLMSALNVFFRDIGQITSVLILFLMLISPIAYTIDMVPKHLMPAMYPNPLFYMIMVFREITVIGEVPWILLGSFIAISLSMFVLGGVVFERSKRIFSDFI